MKIIERLKNLESKLVVIIENSMEKYSNINESPKLESGGKLETYKPLTQREMIIMRKRVERRMISHG